MGQVLCIHFTLTVYLWKRHSLLPFVDGTLRLRSGSVLPMVTQLGRKGWIQGLPSSKACLFSTAHQAGVTQGGAELAGSSLVHGFILGPSLKATHFTWVSRKVDLKGLIKWGQIPEFPPFTSKMWHLTTFCFLAFGAVSCNWYAPMPLEFYDSALQIFPPFQPVPSLPLPPSVLGMWGCLETYQSSKPRRGGL